MLDSQFIADDKVGMLQRAEKQKYFAGFGLYMWFCWQSDKCKFLCEQNKLFLF